MPAVPGTIIVSEPKGGVTLTAILMSNLGKHFISYTKFKRLFILIFCYLLAKHTQRYCCVTLNNEKLRNIATTHYINLCATKTIKLIKDI